MTRIVTEEVEVPVELEVTRIVEVSAGTGEVEEGPSPFEPPTAVIAGGLRSPRQLFYGEDGALYIAEAGTAGDSPVQAVANTVARAGLTGQITTVAPDGTQSVILAALPSINQGGTTQVTGAPRLFWLPMSPTGSAWARRRWAYLVCRFSITSTRSIERPGG